MSIHGERVFVDWVISTLEAGDLTVGDGIAPDSYVSDEGYVVVYPIAGGITEGTLESPRSDASPNIQVTSTSLRPFQTRWLVDRVRTLMDAAVPATLSDGRRVIWLDFPLASTTIIREDDVQPPRWYAPDRFEMGTTG